MIAKKKEIQIGKEEVKLFLFEYDMTLYIKNSTKKLLELVNKFSKVITGYKTNKQKPEFLYTNNKLSGREIKKTIPLTIDSKRIKYLGINLTTEGKDLYSENYKTLKTETEDTNKWKNIPCSWIGRMSTVKMSILPKAT